MAAILGSWGEGEGFLYKNSEKEGQRKEIGGRQLLSQTQAAKNGKGCFALAGCSGSQPS